MSFRGTLDRATNRNGFPFRKDSQMTKQAALVTLAAAAVALSVLPAGAPRPAQAEDSPWLSATLLFQTDVKGKIDPCG